MFSPACLFPGTCEQLALTHCPKLPEFDPLRLLVRRENLMADAHPLEAVGADRLGNATWWISETTTAELLTADVPA